MPTSTAGNPRSDGGFTLTELLVVLVVLGSVTAIVLPRFSPSRPTLESQAEALVDRLAALRRDAIDKGQLRAMSVAEVESALANPFTLKADERTTQRIVYYPLGNSNGGRWTLSDGQRLLRVEIDWLTGSIGTIEP